MVIDIQKGTTDADHYQLSIDQPYMDGISITHGSPRKHIWSYAASSEGTSLDSRFYPHFCPCSKFRGILPLPFVGDHYYCESGSTGNLKFETYFTSDPLWDGKGCGSQNTCCTQSNLPWFFRRLPLTSSDNIEARICHNEAFPTESVLVKETHFYVPL